MSIDSSSLQFWNVSQKTNHKRKIIIDNFPGSPGDFLNDDQMIIAGYEHPITTRDHGVSDQSDLHIDFEFFCQFEEAVERELTRIKKIMSDTHVRDNCTIKDLSIHLRWLCRSSKEIKLTHRALDSELGGLPL